MIINTANKTVELQGETIGAVVAELQKMLPDAWEDYKLTPQTITVKEYVGNYPYIIPAPIYPYIPPFNPWQITCKDGDMVVPYTGTTSDCVVTLCGGSTGEAMGITPYEYNSKTGSYQSRGFQA